MERNGEEGEGGEGGENEKEMYLNKLRLSKIITYLMDINEAQLPMKRITIYNITLNTKSTAGIFRQLHKGLFFSDLCEIRDSCFPISKQLHQQIEQRTIAG